VAAAAGLWEDTGGMGRSSSIRTEASPSRIGGREEAGRWEATAQKLHVHVNTLRHRLARCEELTGRDLTSMDNRVDFYIAIRARSTARQASSEP
jgi:hypothetical protein